MEFYEMLAKNAREALTIRISDEELYRLALELSKEACCKALSDIRAVLDDDGLEDPSCFQRIEEIIGNLVIFFMSERRIARKGPIRGPFRFESISFQNFEQSFENLRSLSKRIFDRLRFWLTIMQTSAKIPPKYSDEEAQ